jgi:antitoxin PrlF
LTIRPFSDDNQVVQLILIYQANEGNVWPKRWKMAKRNPEGACCAPESKDQDCCRIESLITVDERGQMVLPKELRERANIRAGDKLALISWQKDGDICCFTLIKAESLAERVKEFLGPVLQGVGGGG